jgi:NAD(P)-dependent dehydrogenase (short-subunit alcohol dehydrogenase family)
MTERSSLAGRTVAITGAARGLGLATARELSRRGALVVLGDLDADLAREEAAVLDGIGLPLDVTDDASFAGFLAQAAEHGGRVDVLVNNAGIMPTGPFLEQDDDLLRRLYEINVLGVARGVRLALPAMLARRSGEIVNVASIAGRTVAAGMASYCGTKHAVVGMTRALRREHHGSGVGLTLVMPSFANTRITAGAVSGLIPVAQPHQVGRGIADALERGRRDLVVPRSAGVMVRLTELLPRGIADATARRLGADLMFLDERGRNRNAGISPTGEAPVAPPSGSPR